MKDHVLLLHSEIITDYPRLGQLLRNYPRITKSVLKLLPDSEKNIFENTLKSIVAKAWDEWEGTDDEPYDDLGSRRVKCSLCGTDNKLVFIIQNRFNGKTLNVGSTCIREFGNNFEFGKERKTVTQILRERQKIARKANLLRVLPEAHICEEWNDLNYPIVLPNFLTTAYYQIGERLRKLYNDYLNGNKKLDQSSIDEFKKELDNRKKYISRFDAYVEENKNRPFVATKKLDEWARYHLDRNWNNIIRENGYINWGLACRLEEPSFMLSLVPMLNNILEPFGSKVLGVDERKHSYVLKPQVNNDIEIYCPHQTLLWNFGAPLFGEEPVSPLSVELILAESLISNDRSLVLTLNSLDQVLKSRGFYIYQCNYEMDKLLIYDKDYDKYVELPLANFANKFLAVAFGIAIPTDSIIKYIKQMSSKQYSKEEIDDLNNIENIIYENKYIYRKPR